MKKVSLILLISCIIGLLPVLAQAQFKPGTGEITGYMIAEWYSIVEHNTGKDNDGIEGKRGFWLRRIYFTYNNQISDAVKMRFRIEMNSPPFKSNTLVPFVKDAWIDFNLGAGVHLKTGILDPPIYTTLEKIWGYRSLEKTPLDLYKWTSTRDFAVGLFGGNKLRWGGYFGQGSSTKGETDNGKKVYLHVDYSEKGFNLALNGYYEHRNEIIDEYLIHPFASYTADWGRVCLEYGLRNETIKPEDGEERRYKYNVFSAFIVFGVSKKIELILRYDLNWGNGYIENWEGSGAGYVPFADYAEPRFLIAAVSWNATKNVWLIPNIKYTTYADPKEDGKLDEKPDNDMYINVTLFFKF